MAFYLSKILWDIFSPFNLIIFLIFIGTFFNFINFRRFSKIIYSLVLILILLTGILPTGQYMIYLLEKNYSVKKNLPDNIDGILILGGATNPLLTKDHNQIVLNDSAERITESIKLIKKYPNSKVVFAGGSGSLLYPNLSHSAVAKRFYESFGVNTEKIYFDDKSRNTYENILFTKNKFKNIKNERWIVISSAFHLTRVLNVSEKLDLKFIPYATDYRLQKEFYFKLSINFFSNISTFELASHEWLGLIYYYLMGRSSKIY